MTESPESVHRRLVDLAQESQVIHHPMCGAHPALDDGPCRCTNGTLAALIRALITIHRPQESAAINSLACSAHSPNTRPAWAESRRVDFEARPDCVVTPFVVCSEWGCENYPCKTIQAVVDALGIGEAVR
jgi:hypothetical protein